MTVTIVDNVIRWLVAHQLTGSLVITSNAEDRCFAWPRSNQFLEYMISHNWNPDMSWASEMMHGSQYSFREPGGLRPAMQVCLHPAQGKRDTPWPYFLEIDFDLSSPLSGFRGFVGHAGEVITNLFSRKKTNQELVAGLLDERLKKEGAV
jgi:hypothetical protein